MKTRHSAINRSKTVVQSFAALAILLLAAATTSAATFTWDGNNGAGNNNWTGNQGRLNWVGDIAPDNNGTADIIFAGSAKPTPNLNVSYDLNSITFNTAVAFTLNDGGNVSLTLRSGGITNLSAFNQTINIQDLALAANQTWRANSGSLTFTGTSLNLGANTLTLDGANAISIANAISGTGNLVKNGSGTTTLSGANTYSGNTVINSGILDANGAGALGGTDVIYLNGGFLALNGTGDRINDSALLVMNGGTLVANDREEVFGNIDLSLNSYLSFSPGGLGAILTFAGGTYSGGTLTILGWTGIAGQSGTDDRIIFASDPGSDFLQNVHFTGFDPGAIWLPGGEIVPVPEVNTAVLLGLGLAGFGAYRWNSNRRRKS